jgi:hypothetical protein
MHTSSHRVGFETLMSELGRGVIADNEHAWDVASCSFSRESSDQPGRGNHRPQCLRLVSLVSRQRYSITNFQGFNVAGFVQTPPEAGQSRGVRLRATRGSNTAVCRQWQ